MTSPAVIRLHDEAVSAAVSVLHEAFFDYPVMRFIVRHQDERYPKELRRLVAFFVTARVLRQEPILGVFEEGALSAVALVSQPATTKRPAGLVGKREALWAELGRSAQARYEAFSRATSSFSAGIPQLHLNMIGVRNSRRGCGLGRLLLEHVHAMSREAPESGGVSLTTEDPANVRLYEHFGYEIVGHVRVAQELETWGMFREDNPVERS